MRSKFTIKTSFSFSTSPFCVFNIFKNPKVIVGLVNRNVSAPLLRRFAPSNSFDARGIGRNVRYVPHVLSLRGFAQIVPAIIAWVLVLVINLICRPNSGHNSPRDPMGFIKLTANSDQNSAIRGLAPGNFPHLNSATGPDFPSQMSCLWVVVQQFFDLTGCEHDQYLPQTSILATGKY